MSQGLARGALACCVIAVALASTGTAVAQGQTRLPASRLMAGAVPAVAQSGSKVDIVVRLSDAPLAVAQGSGAKQSRQIMTKDQAMAYLNGLTRKQDAAMAQITALGGVELGRLTKALNALIVSVDVGQLPALKQIVGVVSVRPLLNYTRDLDETVPYIGAAAVQTAGYDGTGVRVAVLDSGVDYTHANLGGPGTVPAYDTCYAQREVAPTGLCADYFGSGAPKVVGGYDFVGELWTGGTGSPPRTEDPNPIDFEGHGTHVADIIAGRNQNGTHKGVAPGAKLYAVKVCSSVSTSCNGIALLKGMDFALDPNGDGDMSDAVDVVNMSLGSAYGQKEDDLSEASANAVRFGTIVVAAAGNNADRPYIIGSPSSTPEVISVAQTQVPSALAFPLVVTGISPSVINNTATVEWAPIGAGFSGAVVRLGQGCPAGSINGTNPDDPYFNGNNPSGKVALIDRGACAVSLKVDRATKAGALAVIIANNASGDPPTFSFGGGDLPLAPTVIISQADGNRIKTALGATGLNSAVVATVSPAVAIPLIGSMVASSSRGPSYSYQAIKPDIGAPGASVSAIAGTGTGTEAFGGTSGAAPMVAGAAALLLQGKPGASPKEVKAFLMNNADTNIYTNPATMPGVLAPITRIGGGEVRVDRALLANIAALDSKDDTGSLAFGFLPAVGNQKIKRSVTVYNFSDQARTLAIAPSFRYADDAASGAVKVNAPGSVTVRKNGKEKFDVEVSIDASKLPAWMLNGGSQGGNGPLLQSVEFDGYLTLSDVYGTYTMPWQVLPRKSADISASPSDVKAGKDIKLKNKGAADGLVEVFSWTGKSKKIPTGDLPQPGDNFAVIDLRAVGVRQVPLGGGQFALQFAVNTSGQRAHPNYPAEFDIYIDSNNDGIDDYVVFNLENGGVGATGQNVVAVLKLGTTTANLFFFVSADLNSSSAILTAPLAALGMTPSTKFRFSVYAFDNYFTGELTDSIENMTYTPDKPRFTAAGVVVPAGGDASTTVQAVAGGEAASPSQMGLLLMYSSGPNKNEAETVKVKK